MSKKIGLLGEASCLNIFWIKLNILGPREDILKKYIAYQKKKNRLDLLDLTSEKSFCKYLTPQKNSGFS